MIVVVASVLLFATAAYFVQQQLVNLLLKPSHGQQFIYTSPGGGIGFLFSLVIDVGVTLSLPIIVYELAAFIEPLLKANTKRLILRYSVVSALLAALGLVFGYVVGLPVALHFLGHQFTTKQIHPLFTIQEYMSFVSIYLLGCALLFQLPLILVVINRIRPVPPKRWLKGERYVIAGAFIVSMLMVPTINVMDQLVLAVPIIAMYQIGIVLVWLQHRRSRTPAWLAELIEQDRMCQAGRQAKALQAQILIET